MERRILNKANKHNRPSRRTLKFQDFQAESQSEIWKTAGEQIQGRPILVFFDSRERWTLLTTREVIGLDAGRLHAMSIDALRKTDLFLAGEKSYIRCKAEDTKNGQEARQYIQADLAEELRRIVATKTPSASVFAQPDEWSTAAMLRGDLAEARKAWLDEMRHDPDARATREESDFLTVKNHQGEG